MKGQDGSIIARYAACSLCFNLEKEGGNKVEREMFAKEGRWGTRKYKRRGEGTVAEHRCILCES